MAIWQFRCNIIPEREITGVDFDEIISWIGVKEPLPFKYFPQKKSWSPNIIQLGEIDGNCFEYIYVDEKLSEIVFRLDLRKPYNSILLKVINYVRKIDAEFFFEGVVLPANFEIVKV